MRRVRKICKPILPRPAHPRRGTVQRLRSRRSSTIQVIGTRIPTTTPAVLGRDEVSLQGRGRRVSHVCRALDAAGTDAHGALLESKPGAEHVPVRPVERGDFIDTCSVPGVPVSSAEGRLRLLVALTSRWCRCCRCLFAWDKECRWTPDYVGCAG